MRNNFDNNNIEYNWGFMDGLLWVLNDGKMRDSNDINSAVKDVLEANDKIMNLECERIKIKTE